MVFGVEEEGEQEKQLEGVLDVEFWSSEETDWVLIDEVRGTGRKGVNRSLGRSRNMG